MAEPLNGDRVITPFFPSLFQLARVKLNLHILFIYKNEVDSASTESERNSKKELFIEKGRELMRNFGDPLREEMWVSYLGSQWAIKTWQKDHSQILKLDVSKFLSIVQWRSEGTVDTTRTAQNLVLDESIDIGKRFELACMYCLQESVQALWAEMETKGKAGDFVAIENSTANFWIRWIREGSGVPWEQGISEYLDPNRRWNVRFSRFFPVLQPKDRDKFLHSLRFVTFDDFRFCLNAMTFQEQQKIISLYPRMIFILHLEWPLQDLFLEIVKKRGSLYCKLFMDFWKQSPDDFKERVKENAELKMKVDSLFDAIRRIIKADEQQPNTRKKLKLSQVE